MKSVSASVLAVVLLAPVIAVAQQTPEPELQRPPMPSMEGQQGPVVSATAVSPPSKKRHDSAAVEPLVKPQPAKTSAPEAKSSPGKQSKKAMPAKKAPAAKAASPKKAMHAGPAKTKKK